MQRRHDTSASGLEPGGLAVFPRPRRVVHGSGGAVSGTEPNLVIDGHIAPQGYQLTIGDEAIRIRHRDAAGLRYARHTLEQIGSQFPVRLPGLTIDDWPETPNRAFMLDISRNRVPTMATLAWLVEMLSLCRFNQLQLYVEHTFTFSRHETVWQGASPITAAEMTSLDRLCFANGIELVPCLNVFGHMGSWLKHDRYSDLAECPGNDDSATLEPTSANASFGLELIRELAACTTSAKINIGCDETKELGRGRSRDLVAKRGRGNVFVDHLLRLVKPLVAESREVLFWADMFQANTELLKRLPKHGATALVWNYEPPTRVGSGVGIDSPSGIESPSGFGTNHERFVSPAGFGTDCQRLADLGYPFWVAPGTASWHSLVGRWPHARANIVDAVDAGLAAGAEGILLTDWGDTGHMQPLSVSVLPVLFAGGLSWCPESNREIDLADAADRLVFKESGAGVARVLAAVGALSAASCRRAENGSALFFDLLVEPPGLVFGVETTDSVIELSETLEVAAQDLAASDPQCEQASEIKLELDAAIRLARHGLWRSVLKSDLNGIGHLIPKSDADLHRDLSEAVELQRSGWLSRCRPGGLETSIGFISATLDHYR